MVRTRAIPNHIPSSDTSLPLSPKGRIKLTDQTQPNHILQPNNRQNRQGNPQRRRRVEAQPEEPFVGRVDGARGRVGALKDPV